VQQVLVGDWRPLSLPSLPLPLLLPPPLPLPPLRLQR